MRSANDFIIDPKDIDVQDVIGRGKYFINPII